MASWKEHTQIKLGKAIANGISALPGNDEAAANWAAMSAGEPAAVELKLGGALMMDLQALTHAERVAALLAADQDGKHWEDVLPMFAEYTADAQDTGDTLDDMAEDGDCSSDPAMPE